jgi:Fic family protein
VLLAVKPYIWQKKSWPEFTWDNSKILISLSSARKSQGKILALASEVGIETQAKILVEDVQKTSAIEGEVLDLESIRSSVANRLGLSTVGLSIKQRSVEGVVDMLIDATQNYSEPLTIKRLNAWQAGLFPSGHSSIHKISVGKWRTSEEPMRVISGKMGQEKIHFEAPPAEIVPKEMKEFIKKPKRRFRYYRLDNLVFKNL